MNKPREDILASLLQFNEYSNSSYNGATAVRDILGAPEGSNVSWTQVRAALIILLDTPHNTTCDE